jgi:hypothetical protein
MLEPADRQRPQRGARACGIVGDRVGPRLDAARERAGDAGFPVAAASLIIETESAVTNNASARAR